MCQLGRGHSLVVKHQPQTGAPRMSRQAVTMESLPQAFEVVKEMQADWTGARAVARSAARRWPGSSRAGWPRRWTAGSTPAPCATGATAPAGALDPQDGRSPACPARASGPGGDGEPGRQDPRSVARGLPPPAPEERLQGADARRRGAGPQGVLSGGPSWRRPASATTAPRRVSTSSESAARWERFLTALHRRGPHRRGPRR